MTDVIQAISSVIQTIAVIVSLVYVAREIRDNTRALKSQTYQSIISSYAEIEARISQDAEVAELFSRGSKSPEQLSEDERLRFTQLVCSIFNFYENMHYQYKSGLLESTLWAGWCQSMRDRLEYPGIFAYWEMKSYLYSEEFIKYVRSGKCPKN